jgi:hypothetical protein
LNWHSGADCPKWSRRTAIAWKQFSSHEPGVGNEDWYYLARDTDRGRVFVYHEWSRRKDQAYEGGNEDIDLVTFLQRGGRRRFAWWN